MMGVDALRAPDSNAHFTLALVLRWAVLPVAFVGMGVSAYLSYVHFADASVYCSGSGGCHAVQSSIYATLLSVPIALLGFLLYAGIFAAASMSLTSLGAAARLAPFAVFAMSLSGMLYSGYLTWLELYEIHAICAWCVASASLLTAIFLVSTAEIAASGRWRDEGEIGEPA